MSRLDNPVYRSDSSGGGETLGWRAQPQLGARQRPRTTGLVWAAITVGTALFSLGLVGLLG